VPVLLVSSGEVGGETLTMDVNGKVDLYIKSGDIVASTSGIADTTFHGITDSNTLTILLDHAITTNSNENFTFNFEGVNNDTYVFTEGGTVAMTKDIFGQDSDPATGAGQLAKVDREGQSAAIATQIIAHTVTAGFYEIVGVMEVVTAGGGETNCNVSWTSEGGSQQHPLLGGDSSAGEDEFGSIVVYATSGNITWEIAGSPALDYNIRLRIRLLEEA
jgi:hypothetical protein